MHLSYDPMPSIYASVVSSSSIQCLKFTNSSCRYDERIVWAWLRKSGLSWEQTIVTFGDVLTHLLRLGHTLKGQDRTGGMDDVSQAYAEAICDDFNCQLWY